ncbi:MAG TPA: hypothetical protein PLV58_09175 [Campylobacterales bacterium]|nr:hypothetical protein [Campylobacterales bacterium]
MFEDDVFDAWLDLKSKEIVQKLGKEVLSSDEMIVLVLKAQTNLCFGLLVLSLLSAPRWSPLLGTYRLCIRNR